MPDPEEAMPKNDAELQAFEDARTAENSRNQRLVVVYAPQDNGIWLAEPYSDGGNEYEGTLPTLFWDSSRNHRLDDAVRSYLSKLSPKLKDVHITLRTFKARYPGIVYVACITMPPAFDTSQLLKTDSDSMAIRWFDRNKTKRLGQANMSRENEWQYDLLEKLNG